MYYESLKQFTDSEDKHQYEAFDIYPFDGREIQQERIDELLSKKNKRKTEIIRLIEIEEMNEKQLFQVLVSRKIDIKSILIEKIQQYIGQEPPKEKTSKEEPPKEETPKEKSTKTNNSKKESK